MITLDKNTKKQLIELSQSKNINLEGNIVKIIDTSDDDEFAKYIEFCINKDRETRRKRLEITKQVQTQNNELLNLN